jgi:hypothetical protein
MSGLLYQRALAFWGRIFLDGDLSRTLKKKKPKDFCSWRQRHADTAPEGKVFLRLFLQKKQILAFA